MITKQDLESLIQREAKSGSRVLSLYLNTDMSLAANVSRAFELVVKEMLKEIEAKLDEEQQRELAENATRVTEFVEQYRTPQKGLVIFSDASEDFFWVRELKVKVRDSAWWNETPYLRPLIEIMDEYERYGVVLVDREHARLFTIYLGEIEEQREVFAEADVERVQGVGAERAWSQSHVQRKAEEHARWHLKRVAEQLSRLSRDYDYDRLILAGTVEATSELQRLLPARLHNRVVRTISLSVDASEVEVLEETSKVEQEVERQREAELVEQVITAAAKHDRGVVGLEATLAALQEWRIWQLVYADGFAPPGVQCTNCAALFAEKRESCSYCGGAVRAVVDLIDSADARVVAMKGRVEATHGKAASRLRQVGSIGALLRF